MVGRSLAAALAALALFASAARADTPRVTVFGDSIMTGVQYNDAPMKILQNGLDVRMEVAVCRTIVGEGCPYEGGRPQNLIDRVHTMAAGSELAPEVVVELGYNDPTDTFAAAVEQALATLQAAGAQHVWWLTLHEAQGNYVQMNQMLRDAAAKHPEVTVLDWNAAAAAHREWFQSDGKHLSGDGGLALARLIHDAVLGPAPARTPAAALSVGAPPPARLHRPYAAQLRVSGGTAPYTWRVVAGRPPLGLHLLANGRLYGRPRRAGIAAFTVLVRDAAGAAARKTLLVRVR